MSNVEAKNFAVKLSEFIAQFRILLMSIAIAVIVGLVVFIVVTQINSSRSQQGGLQLELVDDLYAQLISAGDEATKKEVTEKFEQSISTIASDFPNTYYHQRAIYLRASVFFEQKDLKTAKETFLSAVALRPDSQLAGLSLFNAAVAAEDGGSLDEAIALLNKLVDEYKVKAPEVPRALYNLGRLTESKSDYQSAVKYYNRLVDEYSESGWTKTARDRIIVLKSEKRI